MSQVAINTVRVTILHQFTIPGWDTDNTVGLFSHKVKYSYQALFLLQLFVVTFIIDLVVVCCCFCCIIVVGVERGVGIFFRMCCVADALWRHCHTCCCYTDVTAPIYYLSSKPQKIKCGFSSSTCLFVCVTFFH